MDFTIQGGQFKEAKNLTLQEILFGEIRSNSQIR